MARHLGPVLVIFGFGVVLLVSIVQSTAVVPATHFNNGTNAVWLGVEWVYGSHSLEEINALANDLGRRQIRYVFVYTSYLKSDGQFNHTYSRAGEFVQTLKTMQPDTSIQAWIGLPLAHVDLADAMTRRRIVDFCSCLVYNEGFDGVHLDPEPVVDGNASVLVLLNELRREVGPDAAISMATRRIWPAQSFKLPIIAKFAWQADYYRKIAERVDQVAVMTYDSGLPLPSLYRHWVSMQVVQLSQAIDDVPVELLIGLPTSEEWTLTHWPNAENITSGLQGVIDGLSDPNAQPSVVAGVAIYPYWEMDADEWASYESLWLNR
jgi:spore germination protein YaaH